MPALACFYAHPEDEAFSTGGPMRWADDAENDVVLPGL